MDDQDIGGILDLAYGAAVEPALWSRFLEAFAHLAGAEAVLAASPQALFILDAGGKVLHANPAAETLIIQAHVGLGILHVRLCAPTGEATQGLHALVARAAAADPAEWRGGSMALASRL